MKPAPRLFLEGPLQQHGECELTTEQRHYLVNVLRLTSGDPVRVFNALDGEWLAHLATVGKRSASLRCERKTADVRPPPDIDYLFAPLKHARMDYVVQKATELGAKRLRPVMTHRTVSERINLARMRTNAIEAAEQCNLVFLPEICEPAPLGEILADWPRERRLVYCDETAPVADPIAALKSVALPAALLVGPEGGFTEGERELLRKVPDSMAISLGPRIVRADTAAVAGLALLQSTIGDWHQDR
jgi:16S rRNA (uracil1498-N3)-methyltransferase